MGAPTHLPLHSAHVEPVSGSAIMNLKVLQCLYQSSIFPLQRMMPFGWSCATSTLLKSPSKCCHFRCTRNGGGNTIQCSRQDFNIGRGGGGGGGGNKVYGLSVHVPALFLCFVPCRLQTENNRPRTVDAELSYTGMYH